MFASFKFQNNILDFNSIYDSTINEQTHIFCKFVISQNNNVKYFINNNTVINIDDKIINLYFFYINNKIQLFKFNTFNYYILIDNNICDSDTEEIIYYINGNNIYKTTILTIINNSIYDLTKNIIFYVDNSNVNDITYYTIDSNLIYVINNDKIYDLINNLVYYIENNECVNKVLPTQTKKEYYEKNKEHLDIKHNEWKQNNTDKIKILMSDIIELFKIHGSSIWYEWEIN